MPGSLAAAAARALRRGACKPKPKPAGKPTPKPMRKPASGVLRGMRGIDAGPAATTAEFVAANVVPGDVVQDLASRQRRSRRPKKI